MRCPDMATLARRGARAKARAEAARAAALAARHNLPPDLRPREVLLLTLLAAAGRAVTRAEWFGAAGLSPLPGRGRTDGGRRDYLLGLERRGFVVRVKRSGPRGRRVPDLYLPSLTLLGRLAGGA